MKQIALFLLLISPLISCKKEKATKHYEKQYSNDQYFRAIDEKYNISTGKYNTNNLQHNILFSDIAFLNKFNLPEEVFQNQNRVFGYFSEKLKYTIDSIEVDISDHKYFNRILSLYNYIMPYDISRYCTLYEVEGDDDYNNIRFTGYYSPLLEVRSTKDSIFKYAVYSKPDSLPFLLPDRIEIYNGILDSLIIPICYTNNYKLLYNLQLQGSGFIQYENGQKDYLSYGGSNKRRHRINKTAYNTIFSTDTMNYNIDSLINLDPAYIFLNQKHTTPRGAAHVPLVSNHSIAIDEISFPLGSVFLSLTPIYYKKHKRVIHDLRLVFAHDTGGKINGSAHVDLYFGVGENAEKKAATLNKYGKLFLLIPKRKK